MYVFILFTKKRLDGQTDVVDSPKVIKPQEANNKLDKNSKIETPSNKNTGTLLVYEV